MREDWWHLRISGKQEASRLLLLSAVSGNIDLSQHLINISADVNYPAQGYPCTCLRAKAPVEDGCQLSDIKEAYIFPGNTVLMAATRSGNTRMIRMLLESGSEINADFILDVSNARGLECDVSNAKSFGFNCLAVCRRRFRR